MSTHAKLVGWDEIPVNLADEPFMVLVEGEQGAGKTHFAMSFPEPIFILDTENRADKVAAKFAGAKQIYRKRCQSFDDIRQTLRQLILPHFQAGSVVVDSGSDLQRYAEAEFLEEARKERIYPTVLWARVFAKVDGLIATLRDRGFYTVITARLKDEYLGSGDDAKKSGERVLDGYRRLPYLVDVHLRLVADGNAVVIKNGFRQAAVEQKEPLKDPHFDTIITELIKMPRTLKKAGLERVKEAGPESGVQPTDEDLAVTQGTDEGQASAADINMTYRHGREMGLSPDDLQQLVQQVRGVDHTKRMSTEELKRWRRLIDNATMAEAER